MVEEFESGIISDEDVSAAVAIIIRNRNSQALPRLGHPNLLRNLGKTAVAVVVVSQWRNRLEVVRMAIRAISRFMLAAPDIVKVSLQIAQYHQVQKSVAIQINPGGAGGPSAPAGAGFLGYIGKSAVTIIMVEPVAPVGRNV